MRNGIAADRLSQLAHDIRADASEGVARCGVQVAWVRGTQARVRSLPMRIGDRAVQRDFSWTVDQPSPCGGEDLAPSAPEFLLSGLGACLVTGFAVGATVMGIRLCSLEIELHARQDLASLLQLRGGAQLPLTRIDYTIRVSGDGTQEQFERLREKAQMHSPCAMSLLHGVPLHGRLELGHSG